MTSIARSHGAWRVRIRLQGKPPVSKVFKSKTDARIWGDKTERAMQLGILSPEHDVTLGDLLSRYAQEVTPRKQGAPKEASRIDKLCRNDISGISITNLTSNDIAKFRDERLTTVSGTTVVKDLLLISHAIKTAQREWGFKLASNPVDNVNKPPVNKPRDRRLEEGEEDRLLQALQSLVPSPCTSGHRNRNAKRRIVVSGMGPCSSGQKLGASSHDEEW